ncbi:PA14 domain-containing protein [Streptomyces sp. NBC_01619]|uniref:fibronectin type III domain-containing protein n=1 Tax=Streptomyces sp. NBC_01619 TaxID=2975901 RepID=UPI0022516B00|nr:PA14 domain-containing protein [Streptomyces sp. NBC_01619]MCX4512242.1 PA14 domain-containing protein [Streptomyces sp. NBC_01619]
MPQRFRAACATVAALMAASVPGLSSPAHAATVTCADGVWKATYHANTTLTGTPRRTVCDAAISENYGTGAPAGTTLPKDNFSVRWTTARDFGSGGPFTLTAVAQDGVRVYVDGVRKIDSWRNVSSTQTRKLNLTIPKGRHTLRVDFAAWTGAANIGFAYTPVTTAAADKVKPLAPAGGRTAYSTTTYRPTVSWTRNREMDLAGYRVKRCTDPCSWQTVSGTALLTGASFTDVPLANGRRYAYAVAAVDKAGNESPLGGAASVTTTDLPDPAVPAGLTATDTAKGVTLGWTASARAATYRVLRGTDQAFLQPIGTGAAPTYTDVTAKDNTVYFYAVQALDGHGNESARSSVREIRRGDHRVPSAPTLTAAPYGYWDGVRLAWTVPAGDSGRDVRVYRSTVSPVPAGATPVTTCRVDHLSHSCSDEGDLKRGETYHYVVTQVNVDGVESKRSNEVTFTRPGDSDPPAAVTGLTAALTDTGAIAVDWNDSPEADLRRYELRRARVHETEDGIVLEVVTTEYLGAETSEFLYEPVPDGETWAFFVVAVDVYGNALPWQEIPGGYVTVTEPGEPKPEE